MLLETVSYPLTVLANANAGASWYWADEVQFADGSIAYMGLQPNGQYGKTALFSVFGPDTVGLGAGCASGADGGTGTSCHIPYPWDVGKTYVFTITLTSSAAGQETWQGTVTNTATLRRTTIGAWTVAASRGLIEPLLGFAEYFSSVPSCASVPQMDVLYGPPTGAVAGRSYAGIVTDAYSYGSTSGSYIDCSAVAHPSYTAKDALIQAPSSGYSAPDAPGAVTARARDAHTAVISWSAPASQNGIAAYRVYRDGTQIATTTATRYTDTGLTAGTTQLYTVIAVDRDGQTSPSSRAVMLTLPAVGTSPHISPVPSLSSSTIGYRHGAALLGLRCRAARRCTGRLTLTPANAIVPRKRIVAGSTRYSIPAGHTTTIRVPLSLTARRLIKHGHGSLRLILERTPTGTNAPSKPQTVTLRAAP